jgi:uncharacterized membrane protein
VTVPEAATGQGSVSTWLALRLQWAIVPVALAGMGISAYLTYIHYSGVPVYCRGAGGCHLVQSSEYATLMGAPVALFGFVLYTAILGAAFAGIRASGWLADAAPALIFGMALSGVGYSGYLTWLEVYRIYAICTWCVASACLLAAIFLIDSAEVVVSGRWRAEPDDE